MSNNNGNGNGTPPESFVERLERERRENGQTKKPIEPDKKFDSYEEKIKEERLNNKDQNIRERSRGGRLKPRIKENISIEGREAYEKAIREADVQQPIDEPDKKPINEPKKTPKIDIPEKAKAPKSVWKYLGEVKDTIIEDGKTLFKDGLSAGKSLLKSGLYTLPVAIIFEPTSTADDATMEQHARELEAQLKTEIQEPEKVNIQETPLPADENKKEIEVEQEVKTEFDNKEEIASPEQPSKEPEKDALFGNDYPELQVNSGDLAGFVEPQDEPLPELDFSNVDMNELSFAMREELADDPDFRRGFVYEMDYEDRDFDMGVPSFDGDDGSEASDGGEGGDGGGDGGGE